MKSSVLFILLFSANAVGASYNVSIQHYGVATFCALVSILCLFAAYERP